MVSYVAKPDEEFLTFYIERKKLASKAARTASKCKYFYILKQQALNILLKYL